MAITRLKKKRMKSIAKAKQRKKRLKQLLAMPIIKYNTSKKSDKA